MRRALYLLAALWSGAVLAAPAQARPLLVARLDTSATNPHGLLVHVSGLVDAPAWYEQLNNSFVIQRHWSVQLWAVGGLLDRRQPKVEWDDQIHAVPLLDQYSYVELVPGMRPARRTFTTVDSLKGWLAREAQLLGPSTLSPGDWYYRVEVSLTVLSQDEIDAEAKGASLGSIVKNFVLRGQRPALTLSHDVRFTVRSP